MGKRTGAPGKAGDFYIFLNDTWHGRVPNLHGKRAMIVMLGGFPTDYAFPDNPDAVPAERLANIPPQYRQAVARNAPINTNKDTIIHRMLNGRKGDNPLSLFWWARKEREFFAAISRVVIKVGRRVLGPIRRRQAAAAGNTAKA
jgi:hypothetical protein